MPASSRSRRVPAAAPSSDGEVVDRGGHARQVGERQRALLEPVGHLSLGAGTSLSGARDSSSAGSAMTAPMCGPDHLYALVA